MFPRASGQLFLLMIRVAGVAAQQGRRAGLEPGARCGARYGVRQLGEP